MDPISYVNQHVDMINFRCTDNMIFAHAMDGTEAQTIVIAHIVRIQSWSNIIKLDAGGVNISDNVNSLNNI